ncbi:hypothetical protein KVR01_007071 [Diaporthe batatas]|uniref:uncharacterized protein n=1 Tax=Diaporthe batatas TaxID=748121 RepID=UPI001D042F50|nr:uncharacterized protein KVR01_007071 [Diaporthe batatas]KAG8163774.1 hypothetical protein KVR01_007071 [Diaporthe batatas]
MALTLLPRDQETAMYSSTGSRAAQACATCRKQKRKCDKTLPSCSRCSSLQRTCDYSDPASPAVAPSTSAEAFASLQMKLAEIEARLESVRANPAQNPTNASGTPGSSTYVGTESSPESAAAHQGPGIVWPGGEMWVDGRASSKKTKFPAVMFLDSDVHRWAEASRPNSNTEIPMEVLEILASSNVVEETATTYFDTIHRWFPFISKKRMSLGISLSDGGPDLALLFLAMKLITTAPTPEMRSAADSHLYAASKRFLAQLESAGTLSTLYLQAMILVALYEYGHSIYPAAWMTSGSCVRYAAMLGLPSYHESTTVLGPCTTWTEAEERRRVWWATQILDRMISLGSKKRFASGLDLPVDTEMLPVDDQAWDSGDMAISLQRSAASSPLEDQTASPFARLAQASILTSRAMNHCKEARRRYAQRGASDPSRDSDENNKNQDAFGVKEVREIIRDLHILCRAIETGIASAGGVGSDAYFALSPSRCLVWSTMIMVMDLYSCPEHLRPGAGIGSEDGRTEEELKMQVEAIRGLTTTSERIKEFAGELLSVTNSPVASPDVRMGGVGGGGGGGGEAADRMSPLCFDALYCSLATFHWQLKETGLLEMRQAMEQTRAALVRMTPRWRLAGEYLEMERHHDLMGIITDRAGES